LPSAALHIAIVLSPFLALPLVGWAGGRGTTRSFLPALIPAALSAYFAYTSFLISSNGPFSVSAQWAPALSLSLSFRFDGLSTLFAILIAAVGTLIVVYSTKYLEHHPQAGRFNVALFAFMGSMLGLVLSDNVIALFVFWELTGFTSYLLIGFDHERPEARRAATQARRRDDRGLDQLRRDGGVCEVHRARGIMIEWLSDGLFIAGATLALLAGVGVIRMSDVFTRMQASTKASTLGLGCLLAGVALRNPKLSFVVRAASIAAFMLLTTAVAAHVIARAAARSGAPIWKGTLIDERPQHITGQDSM
jgi:monovalent cation/proton antiporter MnhG/PhaG subunit